MYFQSLQQKVKTSLFVGIRIFKLNVTGSHTVLSTVHFVKVIIKIINNIFCFQKMLYLPFQSCPLQAGLSIL
jgi:hypothetical protein